MNRVLLAGATGHVGKAVALELYKRKIPFTALVRNESRKQVLEELTSEFRFAEAGQPSSYQDVCKGHDTVISALGKSVSPMDRSKPSFSSVDLEANSRLIDDALRHGVRKFVYVSAMHADRYPALTYFRVHQLVEEKLKASRIDYSIIRPPGIFSAFLDLIDMAKKGRLMTLGEGDKRTNPVWEGDLATVIVDSLNKSNYTLEPGGTEVLTRKEINELVCAIVAPGKKVRKMPLGLIKALLPLMKIADRNTYDKMAFFTEVMKTDLLAEPIGKRRLAEYIREKVSDR